MKELLEMLNASGKQRFEFKPNGIKFTDGRFIGYVMRAYKMRETWFFNIADADDNWNVSELAAEAIVKISHHLKTEGHVQVPRRSFHGSKV